MTETSTVKAVLTSAAEVVNGVIKALADKKFTFLEVLGLVGPLGALSGLDFNAAKNEYVNADNEGRADILAHLQSVITVDNPGTEEKIEAVGGAIIYLGALLAHKEAA